MELYELPHDIQEKVVEIAKKHTIPMTEVLGYYLMGGEYADTLCSLRDLGLPEDYIKLQNQAYWDKKNKSLLESLNNTI